MNNKYMVYERVINNNIFVKFEPFNINKIELLEKQGMGKIENIIIFDREADAIQNWKDRTNGIIYKSNKTNNNKSIPVALRKCGNIHKRMDWERKQRII